MYWVWGVCVNIFLFTSYQFAGWDAVRGVRSPPSFIATFLTETGVGRLFNVNSTAVGLLSQLFTICVTLYVPATDTVIEVKFEILTDEDELYQLIVPVAPLETNTPLSPSHLVSPVALTTSGTAFTLIETVAMFLHPLLPIPVTVYVEFVNGLTLNPVPLLFQT